MLDWDFDAAIFDMDGTLLDSMRYWRFTSLEYLLKHNLPVKNEDLVVMLDTSSRKLLFDIADREGLDIGVRQDVITELEAFMNHHYLTDVPLKDGLVPAFLERLKAAGKRMCVATAAPCKYARNGLERLGILGYFEFVIDNYAHSGKYTKKDPEYFEDLARRLGTAPERCVVFEDALYAIEAAKKAGCRIVAIEDATARLNREKIVEAADVYILGYKELLD